MLARPRLRAAFGGAPRIVAGALLETVFTLLIVPVCAVSVTLFVIGLPFGRQVGWAAQLRDADGIPFRVALRRLWPHTLVGVAFSAWLAQVAPGALWLGIGTPFALGLVASIPIAMFTAHPAVGRALGRIGLCRIPEEGPPAGSRGVGGAVQAVRGPGGVRMTRRAIAAAVRRLSCLAVGLGVCAAGLARAARGRRRRCQPHHALRRGGQRLREVRRRSVAAFRIAAEHPPYIAAVTTDSTAPDFTDCDMSADPSFPFAPRTVVLHEDAKIRLVGHTFATNWRPESVEFRVGERVETGLHLVQLIRRGPVRDVEMLVVYPADGYWRPKPLPPRSLPDTAYGSSFLFGPIEEDGRPFVAIRSLSFEPATLTFRLVFRDGSRGELSVAEATSERLALSVELDPPVAPGRPSPHCARCTSPTAQADVAFARWTGAARGPGQAAILGFGAVKARSARFGRTEPSRHNLSAPDLVFEAFSSAREGGSR